jgi:hypothetical protein
MGNSRSRAADGSGLTDATGPTRGAAPDLGTGPSLLRAVQGRQGRTDRKQTRHRRLRTFLRVSAILLAGLCAGLIGGMLSGLA